MNNLNNSNKNLELIKTYKLIAENVVDCIWLFDYKNKCFKYINPSIVNLTGLTVDEAMKQTFEDFLTPESIKKLKRYHARRISSFIHGDRSENIVSNIDEFEQYYVDGTIKAVESSTKLIFNEETNNVDILGITRDITGRKNSEQTLINELKDKDSTLGDLISNVKSNFETSKNCAYFFGEFLVYGSNSNIPLKWRTSKSKELFAYLLAHNNEKFPKWKICEALWPEYNVDKISNHLHTTIYKMKKILTSSNIKFNFKFINGYYLVNIEDICTDIGEFDSIVLPNIVITENTIERYEKAFSLYKSGYLEEEDYIWSLHKRNAYSEKFCELSKSLAKYYTKANNYTAAERILSSFLEKFPLDENAHEMILKLYLMQDNHAAFIIHYKEMKNLFQTELGIDPSDSIEALYHKIISKP